MLLRIAYISCLVIKYVFSKNQIQTRLDQRFRAVQRKCGYLPCFKQLICTMGRRVAIRLLAVAVPRAYIIINAEYRFRWRI